MRSNIIIVYFAQIIRPLIPIFFIPLFYKILGKDEFALVTLLSMLLGWMALIDAGMSGSILKYIATSKGSQKKCLQVRRLFFKVLGVLCGAGVIFVFVGVFLFRFIDLDLYEGLSKEVFYESVHLLGFIFLLSLIRGFLSSSVEGFEKHKTITFCSIGFILAANFVSYFFLKNRLFVFGDFGVLNYFSIFFMFILLEVFFLFFYVLYLFRLEILASEASEASDDLIDLGEYELSSFLKLTLQLSFLSVIWIFATNIDKLIISFNKDLVDFSFYQISFQICSSVMMLYIPISKVFMPRLMSLYSSNNFVDFNKLFYKIFYLYAVLTFPAIFLFLRFGEDFLLFWIKDHEAVNSIFFYSKWIFPGFYFAALNNFAFLYFNSRMDLKRHLTFYFRYVCCLIPFVILCALFLDMVYSSVMFFFYNLFYFLSWTLRVVFSLYSFVAEKVIIFMVSILSYWIISEKYLLNFLWLDFCVAVFYLLATFVTFDRLSVYEKEKKVCHSCS